MNVYEYRLIVTADDNGNVTDIDSLWQMTLGEYRILIKGMEMMLGKPKSTPETLADNYADASIIEQTRKVKLRDETLSRRAIKALEDNDIITLEDLLRCNARFLMRIRNLGKLSIAEIERYLAYKGLELERLPAKWVAVGNYDCSKTDASAHNSFYPDSNKRDEYVNEKNKEIIS